MGWRVGAVVRARGAGAEVAKPLGSAREPRLRPRVMARAISKVRLAPDAGRARRTVRR